MNSSDHQVRIGRRHFGLALAASAVLLATGAATAAAQDAAAGGLLFIDGDTVRGGANLTEDEIPSMSCVQSNRYARNEEIVWRFKVYDPQTGEPMDDTMLESLEIALPDQTFDMHYGAHPRNDPVDFFWTYGWDVPEDYPTGELPYTVTATSTDGRTGTYEQFGVSSARLIITDEVRTPIGEEEEEEE